MDIKEATADPDMLELQRQRYIALGAAKLLLAAYHAAESIQQRRGSRAWLLGTTYRRAFW